MFHALGWIVKLDVLMICLAAQMETLSEVNGKVITLIFYNECYISVMALLTELISPSFLGVLDGIFDQSTFGGYNI